MATLTSNAIEPSIVAEFDTHEDADQAVEVLANAKFDIRKVSVIGRGVHTEDTVTGVYTSGDRILSWGKNGATWGGVSGLLFGGLFITLPVLGRIAVVYHLTILLASAVVSAIVVGGLSALGAALYGKGIPKDAVLRYKRAVKEDRFLVAVHGSATDVEAARAILAKHHTISIDVHGPMDVASTTVR